MCADRERKLFRNALDSLNRFLRTHNLPKDNPKLCVQLREFFHSSMHLHRARAHTSLYALMSPAMQGTVVNQIPVHTKWMRTLEATLNGARQRKSPAYLPPGTAHVLLSDLPRVHAACRARPRPSPDRLSLPCLLVPPVPPCPSWAPHASLAHPNAPRIDTRALAQPAAAGSSRRATSSASSRRSTAATL